MLNFFQLISNVYMSFAEFYKRFYVLCTFINSLQLQFNYMYLIHCYPITANHSLVFCSSQGQVSMQGKSNFMNLNIKIMEIVVDQFLLQHGFFFHFPPMFWSLLLVKLRTNKVVTRTCGLCIEFWSLFRLSSIPKGHIFEQELMQLQKGKAEDIG